MADAQKAESTPSPDTEGVGHEQPVAWRWRYVYPGLPVHWTVRQTPIEPRPATEGLVAIEAEPLFLRTAQNTGRDEVLEEAAITAYRVCAETRHVTLGREAAAQIRALKSSPPISTVDEEGRWAPPLTPPAT